MLTKLSRKTVLKISIGVISLIIIAGFYKILIEPQKTAKNSILANLPFLQTATSTPTATATNTSTPTITNTPTTTLTPKPTNTPRPSPTTVAGSFRNPASIGDSLTYGIVPKNEDIFKVTLLEVVRGDEAVEVVKSEANCGYFGIQSDYSTCRLIEGQEYLGVKVLYEFISGDMNIKQIMYPYWSFTLRYEDAGQDVWSMDDPLWAEGYLPLSKEGWIFFKIRRDSQPFLYFQPLLMINEQFGARTQGGYFSLKQ